MEQESTEIILQLPQDIHKLCRICLCVSNTELLSHEIIIFDEHNNLTEIAEMIQFCSTIKVLIIYYLMFLSNKFFYLLDRSCGRSADVDL